MRGYSGRMLDAIVIRGVAALGLVVVFLIVRAGAQTAALRRSRPYVEARSRPVPRALQVLWVSTNSLVPIFALILGLLVPAWIYGTEANVAFPGDTYTQIVGIVLIVPAVYLALSSERHLGRYMVVEIAVEADHRLVTSGPYAWIRHPAYTAILLFNLAAAFVFLHALLFVNFLIVLAIANYRARLEEGLLASEEVFGSGYRGYMARTGRFLPRLRRP